MPRSASRLAPCAAFALLLACAAGLALAACGQRDEPAVKPDAPPPPAPRPAAWRAAFASADRASIDGALREATRAGPASVETLRAFLVDGDRGVREWAAHALGDIAPQDASVVEALRRAFEDEDDWVRWKAARALGCIGPPLALPALPALEQAAEATRETEVVRAAAQRAVALLKGGAPEDG